MIIANKPVNEAERLALLKKMSLLDTPLEERFERITRIICRSLDVPISAISLIDESRQWFKSIQGLDVSETSRDIAFCAHAILEDEPFVVPNALEDPRFINNPLVTEDPSIRFYAGIPLTMSSNVRIGTLCAIDNKPREINDEQMEILHDLAEMVKSELMSIKLTEAHTDLIEELREAERAALVDPLTRLWNRGGGEKLMRKEWSNAQRTGHDFAIAMLDIDFFKDINDQNGHDVGDEVLRKFSRVILSSIRPYDVVSRWGGEEFMVLLPNCTITDLEKALDRILKTIQGTSFNTSAGPLSVTASVGGCSISSEEDIDLSHLVKLADDSLYTAKDKGRNQYVINTQV